MMVTATGVKELRERTGVGMMECKRALEQAGGDLEAAVTLLRKSGQAKMAKKEGRVSAEGVIAVESSKDCHCVLMLEMNCETDFAARDAAFLATARSVAAAGLVAKAKTLETLDKVSSAGLTVTDTIGALASRIGEKIAVRRVLLMERSQPTGAIYSYVHSNVKIGVLVELSKAIPELGREIAMHIAALNPIAVSPAELPQTLVEQEHAIALAQLGDSGKPVEIQQKIVAGKVEKFMNEVTLLGQAFVKDNSLTIRDLLVRHQVEVVRFSRFAVGEGLTKVAVDFAAEVQAQLDGK